jgi:hypothetical protein
MEVSKGPSPCLIRNATPLIGFFLLFRSDAGRSVDGLNGLNV